MVGKGELAGTAAAKTDRAKLQLTPPARGYQWRKWEEFSKAKDNMFKYTDTKINPWWNVESDDKKKARLNCISHILSMIDFLLLEGPRVAIIWVFILNFLKNYLFLVYSLKL